MKCTRSHLEMFSSLLFYTQHEHLVGMSEPLYFKHSKKQSLMDKCGRLLVGMETEDQQFSEPEQDHPCGYCLQVCVPLF